MIPSVLAGQIQSDLKDYIDTTFPITNLVFKDIGTVFLYNIDTPHNIILTVHGTST